MIEKYFRPGIRFKWTKPRDAIGPTDGKTVDSLHPATPLIYDGLDGQLVDPTFQMINVSTIGLSMRMAIPHAWLDYAPGRTSRLPIGPYDVLTGYMSGCIVATWTAKGVRYVGHVGTIYGQRDLNRTLKRTFGFAMSKDARGFNPLGAWSDHEINSATRKITPMPGQRIFGLVTTHGEFFSILMLQLLNNEWCVAGCKSVPPMQHDQLKMFMMHND